MLILGIEAAAKVAGAALYENGQIIAEQTLATGLTHSETLMPMIDSVLKAAGRRPEELTHIALTKGPGSFTGLRIGAATAKGLALGLQIPLVPLNSLEVLAFGAGSTYNQWICVPVMDARRAQVYAAAYVNGAALLEPQAIAAASLAERLKQWGRPCLFMGDAAELHRELFAAVLQENCQIAPAHVKNLWAGAVAALAAEKLLNHVGCEISGSALQLEYLRKPQAEREREARLAAEGQA